MSVDTPTYVTGEHPDTQNQQRTAACVTDGEIMNIFLTAYDIHFIVSNKYYAMKIQEKSESFYISQEIPCIQSH